MFEAAKTSVRSITTGALFEPDILTTHQFSGVFRQKGNLEPEERLMLAVLTDAVECFQKYRSARNRKGRVLFNEAEAWIRSRESLKPFSFEHICEILNINPSYLRVGLMQWLTSHGPESPPLKRIREPLRYQYRMRNNRAGL